MTQYVPWMERQFDACQTPRSMYLSIFNSFRVIWCLSKCVSPKIAIFITFLFPLGDAPGEITLNVSIEREFDAYKLSRSMYPSICNSFPVIRTARSKNRRFHVPQPTFLFLLETPCDYRAICCMDWKAIQRLPNPRSMYLSIFNSFRVIRCLS